MGGGEHGVGFILGEVVAGGAQDALASEEMEGGEGVGDDALADFFGEVGSGVCEVGSGGAGDVSGGVGDRAPLFAAVPVAVVGGIGAEDEEQGEGRAHQGVCDRRDLEWECEAVDGDHDGRPDDADGDAAEDLADHRTSEVEEVGGPVVLVVGDHECR